MLNIEYNFIILFILFCFFIYFISLTGIFLNKNSIIIMLICLEVSFFFISLQLVSVSLLLDDILGMLFSLIILVIAGSDSAIGLALIILFYKLKGNIDIYSNSIFIG